jgi:hypothetical protein
MKNLRRIGMIVAFSVIVALLAITQVQIQRLVVDGYSGSIPVTQVSGRNFVEVEALARMLNGSLSFKGSQVILTLASASANTPDTSAAAPPSEFSKDFLRAGIEAMSSIREWHSALASAIQNQYLLTQDALASYQAQAMTNLRLAQAATNTDADQKGAKLIANELQKMKQLNDKYVAKRANVTYVSPDALKDDTLDQNIIACGKALGAMAANGVFADDISCH